MPGPETGWVEYVEPERAFEANFHLENSEGVGGPEGGTGDPLEPAENQLLWALPPLPPGTQLKHGPFSFSRRGSRGRAVRALSFLPLPRASSLCPPGPHLGAPPCPQATSCVCSICCPYSSDAAPAANPPPSPAPGLHSGHIHPFAQFSSQPPPRLFAGSGPKGPRHGSPAVDPTPTAPARSRGAGLDSPTLLHQAHQFFPPQEALPVPSHPPPTPGQPRLLFPVADALARRIHKNNFAPLIGSAWSRDRSPFLGCQRAHLACHSSPITFSPLPLDTYPCDLWRGLEFCHAPSATRCSWNVLATHPLS